MTLTLFMVAGMLKLGMKGKNCKLYFGGYMTLLDSTVQLLYGCYTQYMDTIRQNMFFTTFRACI